RNGCRVEAIRTVERALAQGQPTEGALARMQESIAREEAVVLFLPHFRGKRALMNLFLTQVDQGRKRISELSCAPTSGLDAHLEAWFGRRQALHRHAQYLRNMNEAVEIAKLPLEQQYPLYQTWRRQRGFVENIGNGDMIGWRAETGIFAGHTLLRCA